MKTKAAVIGSGNIGTDLMIKMLRLGDRLEVAAMAGIDPASDGLARARRLGVPTTADGVAGLIARPGFEDIRIVFDATSARAHEANARALAPYGVRLIDLTPAALGPFVVPAVNLEQHVDAPDLNMVTCGGQATIPIVAAVRRDRRLDRRQVGRTGDPRQHRRVHRDDRERDRVRRRRAAGQGGDHPQPGRARHDHA
jgi:acetaldehyde dehydrogenase